ncbi:hypothetical protein OC846_006674 [Tilletia horrida]|uniref:Uncharacterized protein n=1 Tax=Tilletia horrida TaxID=155126 RepID=A0AAN6JQE0_9BASI|nr:hypothetical protein OC846_006674 [Tilletia horrida]KAK0560770.1 hypothetical protein OC861_006135 [Tilletia horrida]
MASESSTLLHRLPARLQVEYLIDLGEDLFFGQPALAEHRLRVHKKAFVFFANLQSTPHHSGDAINHNYNVLIRAYSGQLQKQRWLLRAYNFCRKPATDRAYAALLEDSLALKARFWYIFEGHTFRIRRQIPPPFSNSFS